MKGKQLTATHKNGQKIVERIFEDGTRFIKHLPYNPQVFVQLKSQFKDKQVDVQISEDHWVRIKKLADNDKLKEAAKKVYGDNPVSVDDMMEMEAKMLKSAGFVVIVEDLN